MYSLVRYVSYSQLFTIVMINFTAFDVLYAVRVSICQQLITAIVAIPALL